MIKEMHPLIDGTAQERAWRYWKQKFFADMALWIFNAVFLIVAVFTGLSVWLFEWIGGLRSGFLLSYSLYFIVFYTFLFTISFPISYISSFVIEHAYGFSTQSLAAWLNDKLKGYLVGMVLGLIMFDTFYIVVRYSPQYWWLLTGGVFLIFSVIIANLAPVVLLPIFYRCVPIDDQSLKDDLIRLAGRAGLKVIDVYDLKMSEKTRKANAALTGLGNTRRILLGDTLLDGYEKDEIQTIVAHEMGHHMYRHIIKGILFGAVVTVAEFYVIFRVSAVSMTLMGLPGIVSAASFPGLLLIFGGMDFLVTPLNNGLSRYFERQADSAAIQLSGKPKAFISAMAKFANRYLTLAYPPSIIEWYRYDHPSIGKRIKETEKRYGIQV